MNIPQFIARLQARPAGLDALLVHRSFAGSLAVVLVALAVSVVAFGVFWPYWRVFDMDVFMVHEALAGNAGLPQTYFDHPGFLTILSLQAWYSLLHAVGLLDVHALDALPRPVDAGDAWMAATRAARLLSLGLASLFVVVFAVLLRRLLGDWRVAALAGFALAFSGGLAMQARIVRTELIAAGCVTTALLILMIAAERPRAALRPVALGVAAMLATFAMSNKIQILILICAIPPIVLAFGVSDRERAGYWCKSPRVWTAPVVAVAVAIVAVAGAALLLRPVLGGGVASTVPWKPFLLGAYGLYQPLIAGWIALGMIVFARVWRVPAAETVTAMAAVVIGVVVGLLPLLIRWNPQNALVVLNPLEQLAYMASWSRPDLAGGASSGAGTLLRSLAEGLWGVFARFTFVLHSSPRPTIFLGWVVLAGALVAGRSREYRLLAQVAVLLATVAALDTIGTVRGLKLEYFILSDPLVIVAAALLIARCEAVRTHRFVVPIGAALIVAHVAVGLAEPIKHTFKRDVPVEFCTPHFHYTKRVESYSFCPSSGS